MKPLVSIGIPTSNRARFLKETLPTVLHQTYQPLEIVISDNCSTDETEPFCRDLAARDVRVRYIRQPSNIGLYPNHNFLIDETRGEYLCLFHDDELYLPTLIEEEAAFLEDHPNVGLVCSDWHLIDKEGEIIGERRYQGPTILPGLSYIDETIRSGRSWLNCPGTMIRRPALGSVRFDEKGPLGFGDFVVWFQMAERHAVGHIRGVLWKYRIHQRALSARTILGMAEDYGLAIGCYLEGYAARWPARRVAADRWRILLRRYLFWSLAYEVYRYMQGSSDSQGGTVFDAVGYRLEPHELEKVRVLLQKYQGDFFQYVVRHGMDLSLRVRWSWPLTRLARWIPLSFARALLGLK